MAQQSSFLSTSVKYLKGVGPVKEQHLKQELGIHTYEDLLYYFPFRYIDRTHFYPINSLNSEMPAVLIKGRISKVQLLGERHKQRLSVVLCDDTACVELLWFKGVKWIMQRLNQGAIYTAFGKPTLYANKFTISHPELEIYNPNEEFNDALRFQAVYHTTEKLKKVNIDTKALSRMIIGFLPNIRQRIPETLSTPLRSKYSLLSLEEALYKIHAPKSEEDIRQARYRLKFEELFFMQLRLLYFRQQRVRACSAVVFSTVGDSFNTFYKHYLPFELTNAQKRVVKEIRRDMGSGYQMNRLLQGDVGSGKTLVALLAMLLAVDNNCQACIMAPTEILAAQHLEAIQSFLKDMPVRVALLTGSTTKKEREHLHSHLRSGELQLLIGTHALIEDEVKFKRLGLVVIDEQHRFGVEQRAKLWRKAERPPHILVMTATPIPRTLSMSLYGDLDYSVIDELPPGRKPVRTLHKYDKDRFDLFAFMRQQIREGRQIYVVYPLIEESEKLDLKDLQDGYDDITRAFPLPEYQVSVVHGRMKAADKALEMQRFVEGKTHIMVATTVIEVGVNVPNASVMIIENAERFGLSQLHQLRGRVGRGAKQSYCILMSSYKLSQEAKIRLQTMVESTDGFKIAEVDMKLRGPGDIQGTRQSGVLDLKIADIVKDDSIMRHARIEAQNYLNLSEEEQQEGEHRAITMALHKYLLRHKDWSQIS